MQYNDAMVRNALLSTEDEISSATLNKTEGEGIGTVGGTGESA